MHRGDRPLDSKLILEYIRVNGFRRYTFTLGHTYTLKFYDQTHQWPIIHYRLAIKSTHVPHLTPQLNLHIVLNTRALTHETELIVN